ncbi:class I SAM-dependent methyltransferase, partial [Candidatus Woesearchaeota archaeon]|nr:class I SAM-dependent methyltransferase [Candidatus Woesearchaeota archaeon]
MTDYSDVRKLYNKTAQNWDRDEPTYRSDAEARPKLVELAEKLDPDSILDLGCGEGYVTRMLAKATKAEITGIDISEKLIKIARRKEQETPLDIAYYHINITDLSRFTEQFDLITAAFSTHYLSLEDHTKLFQQAAKITKNIIIATMEPESYWKTLKGTTTYENDEGKTF